MAFSKGRSQPPFAPVCALIGQFSSCKSGFGGIGENMIDHTHECKWRPTEKIYMRVDWRKLHLLRDAHPNAKYNSDDEVNYRYLEVANTHITYPFTLTNAKQRLSKCATISDT